MKSCNTCIGAVRPSKDAAALVWLRDRGLAYCKPLGDHAGRRVLITLQNAAGAFCNGRNYSPKQVDFFETVGPAPVVEMPKQGALTLF